MKSVLFSLFTLLSVSLSTAQEPLILELDSSQSMCITGKGPGQDGAINPYLGKDSYAIVENMGKNGFEIRIQIKEEIIEIIPIKPMEKKRILLLKNQVMYFDTNKDCTVKVDFEEKTE
ncbi:hypothetical protein [Winogradskyella alexanderae]|uniref:DUF4138 domain-containing protein n=1 Tax=Winogradskyella alexanderae TaxID=2877123 RepID=A0ABS7XU24_9FLAO|nr:hypothetical protein [Winogradskyella alexanderae]MCA0132311.1 hypothetical protein [Winogradskyella alexanderae]